MSYDVEEVRKMLRAIFNENEATAIAFLFLKEEFSASELESPHSQLDRASFSRAMSRLKRQGLIIEREVHKGIGRPKKFFSLKRDKLLELIVEQKKKIEREKKALEELENIFYERKD